MKSQVADYQTKVMCLRIVPLVASEIRITNYPRDLMMSNGKIYKTAAGYEFTGYTAGTSTSPALIDLQGIADIAGISKDAVKSGVLDNARCYLFATNWNSPVEDYEPIVSSILGKTTFSDNKYSIEEMALIDTLNQAIGITVTPGCRHTLGDAGCKVNLPSLSKTGTITSVNTSAIVRDSARTEAVDYFALGTIQFTSGANSGLKAQEIKSYALDGTIEIFETFYYVPEIGDTYTISPGCRKRVQDCRDKYSNMINFGGFPDVPTSSTYSQVGLN